MSWRRLGAIARMTCSLGNSRFGRPVSKSCCAWRDKCGYCGGPMVSVDMAMTGGASEIKRD
jgi:hypothetical protein